MNLNGLAVWGIGAVATMTVVKGIKDYKLEKMKAKEANNKELLSRIDPKDISQIKQLIVARESSGRKIAQKKDQWFYYGMGMGMLTGVIFTSISYLALRYSK